MQTGAGSSGASRLKVFYSKQYFWKNWNSVSRKSVIFHVWPIDCTKVLWTCVLKSRRLKVSSELLNFLGHLYNTLPKETSPSIAPWVLELQRFCMVSLFIEIKYFRGTKKRLRKRKSFYSGWVGWLLERLYTSLAELFYCFQNEQLPSRL